MCRQKGFPFRVIYQNKLYENSTTSIWMIHTVELIYISKIV